MISAIDCTDSCWSATWSARLIARKIGPLVILEAFVAGVPVVATDVGACRELIYGRNPMDRALGVAGAITRVAAPYETADAILNVCDNPARALSMGLAGRCRAEIFYAEKDVMQAYREVFAQVQKG